MVAARSILPSSLDTVVQVREATAWRKQVVRKQLAGWRAKS
jgi:hypothetical protein